MPHGLNTNNICSQVANLFQPSVPEKNNFVDLRVVCSLSKTLHFVPLASPGRFDNVGQRYIG